MSGKHRERALLMCLYTIVGTAGCDDAPVGACYNYYHECLDGATQDECSMQPSVFGLRTIWEEDQSCDELALRTYEAGTFRGTCLSDGTCNPGLQCEVDNHCWGIGDSDTVTPTCGDGVCDVGETCPSDCGTQANVLPVSLVMQSTQVWCWAATSQMTFQYFGYAYQQCDIVSSWTQLPCCPAGNGLSGCYVTAPDMSAIALAIEVGGVPTQLVNRALSFQEIVATIDSGRPMIVGYTGSFGGHVVVLHGYDAAGNVYIQDPYYGTFVVPYSVSGIYSNSKIWSTTLIVG